MDQKHSRGTGSSEVIGSFNVNSFNTTVADDKAQILQWLSSLEPQKRHQHLRGSRLGVVGQWIFQRSEFQRWGTWGNGSAHPVLFCYGDPGVGKTHLSSLVIDHFYGSRRDITVAGLYCDYLDRKEQAIPNMLGAMLKQLVGSKRIPGDIRKAFEEAKEHFGGVGPDVPQLLKMLKAAIAQRQQVVICIDGLDESLAAQRAGLLGSLQGIVQELPNVRLFLTGRPFIRSEVERYFPGVDTISVSPTKEDVKAFLRMKLDGDIEPDAMDEHLRADIMEIIPNEISEIFLLVSLSIEAILAETTIYRRKQKLKEMSAGQDVGDVYSATLERIRAQKRGRSRLGMEAIMWVAHSERPLKADELCHALGVELGSNDLNSDNTPSIRTILNCALGLVTVDSSSSTARLVHFTLQEYILANPTLFHNPHSAIAEVCLTYLNFRLIRGLSLALYSPPPQTPFLEYASCYWGAHSRRETSKCVVSLALNLLDRFDTHISCKPLLRRQYWWRGPFEIKGDPTGFSGLHGAAVLGAAEILVSLLKFKKWDINATDLNGDTALLLAVRQGHDGAVKVLLEQEGVDLEMADKRGRTALALAAKHGYEGIAETLLERSDVNPNPTDDYGQTPVSLATKNGHERVVKVLLGRTNVNPDTADNFGQTPLLRAAGKGHEGITKLLLERADVNPNVTDRCGRAAFSWAAIYGHEGIVKMLLERNDVDPDRADQDGRTPLSLAAGNGRRRVVKMLLERNDVNPDAADKGGRTPFSWAVWGPPFLTDNEGRREGVVMMLLERSDLNPDTADNSGRTPLSWAAESGYQGIAEMLLERSDVNPAAEDKNGRTTLSWAAGGPPSSMYDTSGCEGIVKALLERNNVNPDRADKNGRTPLSWAAESGYEGIVKILLERSDVNPATEDSSGRTPLSWASGNGCTGVVTLLEGRCDPIAKSELTEESSAPSTVESPELAEPPPKRIRLF